MLVRMAVAPLVLVAGLTLSSSASAAPASGAATYGGPTAQQAGGDVAALNPAIVNIPIVRTKRAIDKAALSIDQSDPTTATNSLAAAGRYLTRSYQGAAYLIAHQPPPVAAEDRAVSRKHRAAARKHRAAARRHAAAQRRATVRKYRKLALRAIREYDRAHAHARASGVPVAHASGGAPAGPTIADGPTAVFSVFTSYYNSATQMAGMLYDATGPTVQSVQTTINSLNSLRGQLIELIHTSSTAVAAPAPTDEEAEPPDPGEEPEPTEPAAPAEPEEGATTFDLLMPGLAVLLGDEIQQLQAESEDPTLATEPVHSVITTALAGDQQLLTTVNTYWPPVPAED